MEELQLLDMCRKNYTTVKKAFSKLGLSKMKDGMRPFKELSEEELFAFLMNWILNQMGKSEIVTMRYKVKEETYQMKFHYVNRQIVVSKPTIISTSKDFLPYDWMNEDNYNEMTAQKIEESIRRADEKNKELPARHMESENMSELTFEVQHNLTNDEYELIESFLNE